MPSSNLFYQVLLATSPFQALLDNDMEVPIRSTQLTSTILLQTDLYAYSAQPNIYRSRNLTMDIIVRSQSIVNGILLAKVSGIIKCEK